MAFVVGCSIVTQVPELTARSELYGESNPHVELDKEKLEQVGGGGTEESVCFSTFCSDP